MGIRLCIGMVTSEAKVNYQILKGKMAMITKELYFKNYGGEITCGELEEYALAEIRYIYK